MGAAKPPPIAIANGGESGIRTHEAVTRLPLFESDGFNHSPISPLTKEILHQGLAFSRAHLAFYLKPVVESTVPQ